MAKSFEILIRSSFLNLFPVMFKEKPKRRSQLVGFDLFKEYPTQFYGVTGCLSVASGNVNKVVDDNVMIFYFALLVVVNIGDHIKQNWVFNIEASFLFGFADNRLLWGFSKLN